MAKVCSELAGLLCSSQNQAGVCFSKVRCFRVVMFLALSCIVNAHNLWQSGGLKELHIDGGLSHDIF